MKTVVTRYIYVLMFIGILIGLGYVSEKFRTERIKTVIEDVVDETCIKGTNE